MNKQTIIGLDEAGRGALAGPIVAAAVLSQGFDHEQEILSQVKDSKKLSPKKREQLFELIDHNFIWSVDVIDNSAIDALGIQPINCLVIEQALDKILERTAVENLIISCDYIGAHRKYIQRKNISFYKNGESLWPQIAAASIMAKVYRDNLMRVLSEEFPGYDFDVHKGYGTKIHLAKIRDLGLSAIHRRSFLSKYIK